ncbi:flagellar protein FlaG [Psychrosphaera sp.]|nr:flagellar protein FlaG [Psychrosphaera sp.]
MNTLNSTGFSQSVTTENAQQAKSSQQVESSNVVNVNSAAKIKETEVSQLTQSVNAKDEISKNLTEQQRADDTEVLEDVASNLQDFVNLIDKELKFSVDTDTGRHVVTVKDGVSGEIIRQIPSEEVLKLAQNLAKISDVFTVSGKLLETKV